MIAKALERSLKWSLEAWRGLALDAKVVAAFGIGNWLLLFANHTTVAATRDVPLWALFPAGWDIVFLVLCGALPRVMWAPDFGSRARFRVAKTATRHTRSVVRG